MPRHSSLADQLKALIAYRSRPEGPIEPVKTNWRTQPANDNADPEEVAEFGYERSWRMTPSVNEIMRHVEGGPTVKNEDGQIIRIGGLRFSDGTQTERAYTYGADGKLIQYDALMPIGAMLGTRDKTDAQLGGAENPFETKSSNQYFAEMLGALPHRFKTGGKRVSGRSYTAEESRAMLAEAIANTNAMPAVTYCAPGLPCGSAKVADSFVGMQKGKKGESGSIAWEDLASARIHRDAWAETLAYLSKEDVDTLDRAMEAKTVADLGGDTPKRTAIRKGKERLIAANDNLVAAMKAVS